MAVSIAMPSQIDPEPFLNPIKLLIRINHHRKDVLRVHSKMFKGTRSLEFATIT